MRMYDIIMKKRNGEPLRQEEIAHCINGYVNGSIPDYQMSALLMAIYFQGMDDRELADLTMTMAHSGEMVDLSAIAGLKVDKHSTGGVGDKTTLVALPLVAACGGKAAKMSGRGLGHTGGTIDKLESIPQLRTSLSREEFLRIVNLHGLSVIGQSSELAPADKKLYALRDVTATVESIPLIAASIMSKKLAAGSDCILLDVKVGSGAFMKTLDDALLLAQKMVAIGENNGRRTIALLTDMDRPLGQAIGNSLEIIEVVRTLQGQGPADLTAEGIEIAGHMLYLAGKGSLSECCQLAQKALQDGSAFQKLLAMVAAQGGDCSYLQDLQKFPAAAHQLEIRSETDGYITHMDAEKCGLASVLLGAGRETKQDAIDFAAGILLCKKTGDAVARGDVLAILCSEQQTALSPAADLYQEALTIGPEPPTGRPLLLARVTKDGSERFVGGEPE